MTDQRQLRECLRVLVTEVGHIARRKGLKGRVVTMKIRLERFETHTRQRKIREATNADGTIHNTAWELYQGSGFAGRPVRLIGLGISDWGDGGPIGDLFDDPDDWEREERLYATMDEVTEKFGEGKISLGLKKRD